MVTKRWTDTSSCGVRWSQGVAILSQTPHELVSVHLFVTIIIHAAEDNSKSADSVGAPSLELAQDLVENLIGWLTLHSKDWVHIWVVSAATDCESIGELLVVELVVSVLVKFVEDGAHLEVLEQASNGLESL